jgi:DNA-directed RNA polymerase specialized sigma24 family protein
MSHAPAPFPPPEEGLRLHLRLLVSEADASADICRAYLPPLEASLAAKFRGADPETLRTAAHDALVAYFQNPSAYDPPRGDLAKYLRMAARADLSNLLRTEKRHHRGRVAWSVVELGEDAGNLSGGGEEPPAQLQRDEEAERCRARLQRLRDGCTPEERRVLDLILAGERANHVFAAALGRGDLPADEQAREVKRVKDRLKKRLERGGPGND